MNDFRPISVIDVDVDDGAELARVSPTAPRGPARALLRRDGRPIGLVDVDLRGDGSDAARLLEAARALAPAAVLERQRHPSLPPPTASVVIATKDRAESLERCLGTLRASDHGDLQVVVVDNAPSDTTTRRAVLRVGRAWPELDYFCEPKAGASRARNCGVEHAANDVVLFVDDDVEVDHRWASTISRSFDEDPSVRCATGLVVAAELTTQAEVWFEQFGGFGKGFRERKFDLGPWRVDDWLYPYAPGAFGSGNNAAVWRPTFLDLGGFDPCLGPGTPARAAEDLDLFLKFIHAGWRVRYEPSALVWHHHRRELDALDRQVHDYGVGLAALYTKWALRGRPFATDLAMLAPAAVRTLLWPGSRKNAGKSRDYPRRLTWRELWGVMKGPAAYLRAKQEADA